MLSPVEGLPRFSIGQTSLLDFTRFTVMARIYVFLSFFVESMNPLNLPTTEINFKSLFLDFHCKSGVAQVLHSSTTTMSCFQISLRIYLSALCHTSDWSMNSVEFKCVRGALWSWSFRWHRSCSMNLIWNLNLKILPTCCGQVLDSWTMTWIVMMV